jgi:phosphate transport system substrate-binding protein
VKAGTVDFGASDAALSDAALKDMPRRVVHIPTVGGAVVLAYNLPGFDGRIQLTPELVAGIYLGDITTWNDKRIAAGEPRRDHARGARSSPCTARTAAAPRTSSRSTCHR